jgi:tetratricopeptide (TPR) repeat protein
MWRERMRNALLDVAEGRPQTLPPGADETNQVNDEELARGIGTPLADAAARCEHLLSEIIDLYSKLGERPFQWNVAKTTTAAVLRNSYTHPRVHMYEYFHENGQAEAARKLFEDAVADMRAAQAPAFVLGTVLYNLATVRAQQGRKDEALELIAEAIPLRPDARELARTDEDLGDLRDDPRLKELLTS